MMNLRKITIQERKTGRKLIDDLTLTVNHRDKLAIIGEEGNGKSTLLKLMSGKVEIPDYLEVQGEITGNDGVVGYLAQQPAYDSQMLVADLFPEVDWNEDLIGAMTDFKIDNLYGAQRFVSLSGGEKIRYLILALLAQGPEMILLDEPTNDIDLQAVAWLENFIVTTELPVVYVSHDETFIERTATKILHLELAGRKDQPIHHIDHEGYEHYRQRRAQRISKEEQAIKSQRKELGGREEKLRNIWNKAQYQHQHVDQYNPGLQKKVAALKNQRQCLEKDKGQIGELIAYEKESSFSFDYLPDAIPGKRVSHLESFQLKNEKGHLVENLRLEILTGDKIVIVGKNGVGKSTLLKVIYQQLQSDKVGYMPQNYSEVLPIEVSGVDFLTVTGDTEEKTMIYTMLGNVNFTREEMLAPIGKLSGGQQGKLLLLRMIIAKKEILILDEPTRNLSAITNPHLYQELKAFKGTIISVSHDRKFIREVGENIYELKKEGLVEIKQ